MLDVPEVLEGLSAVFEPAWLAGVRVLVTAGPTREAIDPVGERLLPRAPAGASARADRAQAAGHSGGTLDGKKTASYPQPKTGVSASLCVDCGCVSWPVEPAGLLIRRSQVRLVHGPPLNSRLREVPKV